MTIVKTKLRILLVAACAAIPLLDSLSGMEYQSTGADQHMQQAMEIEALVPEKLLNGMKTSIKQRCAETLCQSLVKLSSHCDQDTLTKLLKHCLTEADVSLMSIRRKTDNSTVLHCVMSPNFCNPSVCATITKVICSAAGCEAPDLVAQQNKFDSTALHWLILNQRPIECLYALIQAADRRIYDVLETRDNFGVTALNLASTHKNEAMVTVLQNIKKPSKRPHQKKLLPVDMEVILLALSGVSFYQAWQEGQCTIL